MKPKPAGWAGVFEVEKKEKRIQEIEAAMAGSDFWSPLKDGGSQSKEIIIKELGELQDVVRRFRSVEADTASLKEAYNEDKFFKTRRAFRDLEIAELFKGAYDKQSAVISLYPGAGGDDATDWARILFEMYSKYVSEKGWKTVMLDDNPNRRSMEVKGPYAYGYLKREAGVHRLVRISPFSAQKLRHTSFALVEVVPDLPTEEEAKLTIPEKDLKVEFFRSGGPGGQNVNKVETAVRIVHIPTGLTASSQAERSQAQNRERTMKLLKSKLFHLMQQEKVKELSELRVKVKPEWGNQIRSYVLNPYQLVKDHRTEVETSRVEEVLNGNIDKFVEAEVELMGSAREGER